MGKNPLADYMLDQAQAFRDFLVEAFKDGKEVVMSEMTNDGSVFYILTLLASQEV